MEQNGVLYTFIDLSRTGKFCESRNDRNRGHDTDCSRNIAFEVGVRRSMILFDSRTLSVSEWRSVAASASYTLNGMG